MKVYKIKTWGCAQCAYKQDFGFDAEKWAVVHPGINLGVCPGCLGHNLEAIEDESKMSEMYICEESDGEEKFKTKEEIETFEKENHDRIHKSL